MTSKKPSRNARSGARRSSTQASRGPMASTATGPTTAQTTSADTAVSASERFSGTPSSLEGRNIQTERKMALTSIPAGTTDRLSMSSASPCAEAIPATAGTIVVGTVPSAPPTPPPYLSIRTVTRMATAPEAIAAGSTSSSTRQGQGGGT